MSLNLVAACLTPPSLIQSVQEVNIVDNVLLPEPDNLNKRVMDFKPGADKDFLFWSPMKNTFGTFLRNVDTEALSDISRLKIQLKKLYSAEKIGVTIIGTLTLEYSSSSSKG